MEEASLQKKQTRRKIDQRNEPHEIPESLVLGLSGLSIRIGVLAFKTDAAGHIDLVRSTYSQITLAVRHFECSVTLAMFEYYCTMAYWIRLYQIRLYEGKDPHGMYRKIQTLFPNEYPLPTCINVYLAGLGSFTDPDGRRFGLQFDDLDSEVHWQGFRGSFTDDTVASYISGLSVFPVMYRMYAESMLSNSWIDAHFEYDLPGFYAVPHAHPNNNLNGYFGLKRIHPDAKHIYRRLNVRATFKEEADEFITPQSRPAHVHGLDYIPKLANHVASKLLHLKVTKVASTLPVNTVGSLSQYGFNEIEIMDDTIRPLRFSEQQTTGLSAHQLSVNIGNAILIMRYRIKRQSGQTDLIRGELPFTWPEVDNPPPQQWGAHANDYFNFGGQDRWNRDDFNLPQVSGRDATEEFVKQYIQT